MFVELYDVVRIEQEGKKDQWAIPPDRQTDKIWVNNSNIISIKCVDILEKDHPRATNIPNYIDEEEEGYNYWIYEIRMTDGNTIYTVDGECGGIVEYIISKITKRR